jgi:hypothetical protein
MSSANDKDFRVCCTRISIFSLNVKRESAVIFLLQSLKTVFLDFVQHLNYKYNHNISETAFCFHLQIKNGEGQKPADFINIFVN